MAKTEWSSSSNLSLYDTESVSVHILWLLVKISNLTGDIWSLVAAYFTGQINPVCEIQQREKVFNELK